jgi:hypothetical protein
MSLQQYRIWCVTDGQYEYAWSETEPTVCPVNPGHTIDTTKTAVVDERVEMCIICTPAISAVEPGASLVVANDRPAVEIQDGDEGWGALDARWPHELNAAARLKVTIQFILKALGTGTVARMSARIKAEGTGDDSSEAWADTQYDDAVVTHALLGEVFEATFDLDASGFDLNDAVALQVGRDGGHANDTLDQPVQIFGVKGVAI